ncbi:kinesin-like protein costa [Copidosoma floridanum]|uniref:kinesin-like protein costa n=1 Tax=Copidosoma floridanum TaxID=29053 RepID=UPI0006C951BD|nr:kinesin-like protein costa [Copidosoma floridanum]
MMHYGPWINPQQMLMEQRTYYQCANSYLQSYFSSSDHQEEENDNTGDDMPCETSGDQSPNAEMFRLAFAASQWSKLVFNAEGLFNKLISTNVLPQNEQNLLKNQIEQWLCMKQEYEECIAGDDSSSLQGFAGNTRKSLEKIEEVTETDESDNWKSRSRTKSCSMSDSDMFDDNQSDTESELENSHFLDKLEEFMNTFKIQTDGIIDTKKGDFFNLTGYLSTPKRIITDNLLPIKNSVTRRVSILPYSNESLEIKQAFQGRNRTLSLTHQSSYDINLSQLVSSKENEGHEHFNENLKKESLNTVSNVPNLNVWSESLNPIGAIIVRNNENQMQAEKVVLDLNLARKEFEELQKSIKVKEQFIYEMRHTCSTRNNANSVFDKSRSKLEEKCRNIKRMLHFKEVNNFTKDSVHEAEIEKFKSILLYYQKKLKDTKVIKQVMNESGKTLAQAKDSLKTSRKQLEKLKQVLEGEENRRKESESKFNENQKKSQELNEIQESKVFKIRGLVHERDMHSTSKLETNSDENLTETNEKVSYLNYLVNEKVETENSDSRDKCEILRQEIIGLRVIRDRLLEAKNEVANNKFLTSFEQQRQLLLIDEYVESIDVMMEQKNIMRCNNGHSIENKFKKVDEQMSMMNRLDILSHDELVNLFYRYFYKVIDLKDSSRTLEVQNTLLEDSLKKERIESEAKVIVLQKLYQRQLTRFCKYYAEETSSSSYDAKINRNKNFVAQIMKENYSLKKRLTYFESLFKTSEATQAIQSNSVRSMKQMLKPELMQIVLPKTKVTRQGNKLIFQTNKKKK